MKNHAGFPWQYSTDLELFGLYLMVVLIWGNFHKKENHRYRLLDCEHMMHICINWKPAVHCCTYSHIGGVFFVGLGKRGGGDWKRGGLLLAAALLEPSSWAAVSGEWQSLLLQNHFKLGGLELIPTQWKWHQRRHFPSHLYQYCKRTVPREGLYSQWPSQLQLNVNLSPDPLVQ